MQGIQNEVYLLCTHRNIENVNCEVQRLIESSGQNEKLVPDGMRKRITEIYGEKPSLEVYNSEVSSD